MNTIYRLHYNTHILILKATSEDEANDLRKFARIGDTFTGELKHDHHYKHPHIVLRKEI